VILNTMDPVALVGDRGRHVVVTGPLACTPAMWPRLRGPPSSGKYGNVARSVGGGKGKFA